MKVILTKDVKGQGKKGDVINVSDGYATNYLFKNNLATVATSTALNSINQSKEAEKYHNAMEKAAAVELAGRLNATTITVPLKVSENGKIFGALTSQMIADELLKQGITLDKRKIILSEPIKLVGKHEITIKPYAEVSAKLFINVVPQ